MDSKNIFQKFILDVKSHFFAFILSIIFSLLFFYYIEDIQLSSGLIVNDIDFKNLDTNFIIKEVDNTKVSIYFKTTKENISLIDKKILKPYIDLTNVKLGKNIIKIKLEQDLLPDKTRVYKIEPKFVTIVVDRKVSKFLKIKPDIINDPLTGYVISNVYFTSDKVLVEGPKSILENMETIKTDPINVDGLDRTVLKDITFNIKNIRIISPKKVSAIIEIKKQYELQEINNIKIIIINKNPDFEYILNTDKLSVKLLVPPMLKNETVLNNLSFKINGDSFFSEGSYKIIPVLKVPEQYDILEIVPDEIILKVKKKNIVNDKASDTVPYNLKTK